MTSDDDERVSLGPECSTHIVAGAPGASARRHSHATRGAEGAWRSPGAPAETVSRSKPLMTHHGGINKSPTRSLRARRDHGVRLHLPAEAAGQAPGRGPPRRIRTSLRARVGAHGHDGATEPAPERPLARGLPTRAPREPSSACRRRGSLRRWPRGFTWACPCAGALESVRALQSPEQRHDPRGFPKTLSSALAAFHDRSAALGWCTSALGGQ